jgi:predicted site-specific integrase-resolvase
VPDHDDDLITTATACAILGGREAPINPSTLWRWIKAGRISPPLKPGPGTARFRRSVLIAERDAIAA